MFYDMTHKSDIFYFLYLSYMPNQAKEAQHFGPPREFWGDHFSQYLIASKILMDVLCSHFLLYSLSASKWGT